MQESAKVDMMPNHGLHRRCAFIDLHQDMLSGVAQLDGGFPAYGSSYLTGSSRAAAVWSSLYPNDPASSLLAQLNELGRLMGSHATSLRLMTTRADLDVDDPRTGVLPHSEGFHLPAIEPEALHRLWSEHSLRSLSLTWNYENDYGFSCYEDSTASLKPAGRSLLRALEDSPICVDLAHLNEAGFYEALDVYSRPVLVTHTFSRAVVDHPRGLTDGQLRVIGEHGGLVGLAFAPDFLGREGSIDEALRHIDKIASLTGEDALSIGSDWGVVAMGQLADHGSLAWLIDAVENSYSEALARKFAYGNAYEFLQEQLPEQ